MKKIMAVLCVFSVAFSFQSYAFADESASAMMKNLMEEMKQLRNDYEAQISTLVKEIEDLKKNQTKQISQSIDDMKKEVEKDVDKKVDDKLLNVDYVGRQQGPFGKGGLVAKTQSGFAEVSVGGYADIELENFQESNSAFDQHRFILNIGASLGERLRFFSEYEIEHGGPDAAGGGSAKIEQAWIDFLIHEAINFRAGALLMPFGRYNIYHDSDLQDLTDRPLVNRDVIPTTWTEAGAGFHGRFYPTIGSYEDLELSYEFYMVNGLDAGLSDTGLRGARGSLGSDNNNNKAVVGRVVASPAIGHEIGLSGYWGDYNNEDDSIAGIGVDFLSTWGPLELVGEWAYFSAGESGANVLGTPGDVADHTQGLYVQANYHFWFDFLDDSFLGRAFDNPTFTLVGRYGWAQILDDFDATGRDNEEWRWTIGLNYRPVESWVLKLEYQNNETQLEALERGNSEGFIASIAMGF